MDDEDVFINAYAVTDAIIMEVMDMTWKEGLEELDAFFDANASVGANEAVAGVVKEAAAAGNADVDSAVARENAREEVQAIADAELASESSAPATTEEDVAARQQEAVEPDHRVDSFAPAMSKEEKDHRTEPDRVTALPVNNATSIEHPNQPHSTKNIIPGPAESDHAKVEDMQVMTAAPAQTRPRKDSMNISFLLNAEDEPPRTLTMKIGSATTPVIHPGVVREAGITSETWPPSTISSAGLPPQLSFTRTSRTPEQNIDGATSEILNRPQTEMNPLYSECKSSLMDEMQHEEEDAYFTQSGSAMRGAEKCSTPLDDDSITTIEDEGSLADAPGSPDSRIGPLELRERLREAVAADEEAVVEEEADDLDQDSLADALGSPDSRIGPMELRERLMEAAAEDEETDDLDQGSLADAPGSPDSRMSPINLRERLREVAAEDEEMGVDEEADDLDQGSLADAPGSTVSSSDWQDLPEAVAQDEQTAKEDEDKEAESGCLHDGDDAAPPEQAGSQSGEKTVTGISDAARAELQQIVLRILADRAKNGEAAEFTDTTDSVTMPEPAPAPPPQPMPLTQSTDVDAGIENAKYEKQVTSPAVVEMSEDELAPSSSTHTVPRKRKYDVDGDPTLVNDAHATKKAKTNPTSAAALTYDDDTTTLTNSTADNKPISKLKPQKRPTKAEINAAKRSSKPKNPNGGSRYSVSAKELKGMAGMFTSSGGEKGDDGIAAGDGGGGGRKTRAQIEADKKAEPNAAGAVRERRNGV